MFKVFAATAACAAVGQVRVFAATAACAAVGQVRVYAGSMLLCFCAVVDQIQISDSPPRGGGREWHCAICLTFVCLRSLPARINSVAT